MEIFDKFFKPDIKKMEGNRDIEGLIKALRHKDKIIRRNAAQALGNIGDPRGVEPLTQALKDEDGLVREAAEKALGKTKEGRREKEGDSKEEKQAKIIQEMFRDPKTRERILHILAQEANKREELAKLATKAYTNFKLGFSITPPKGWKIEDFSRKNLNPHPLGALCSVLFHAPTDRKLPGWREGFQAIDEFLGRVPHIKIGVTETDMTLDEVLEQKPSHMQADTKVVSERRRTINDLNAYERIFTQGSEAAELNYEFMKSEFNISTGFGRRLYVKTKVVCLVEKGRLYFISCAAPGRDYDRYSPVFEKSIQAFHLREPEIEALIQELKDGNEDVRMRTVLDLWDLFIKRGDKRAVEPLIQALKDEEYIVRANAISALGESGDARAIEPLTQLLNDKDEHVRKKVKQALEKIKAKKS